MGLRLMGLLAKRRGLYSERIDAVMEVLKLFLSSCGAAIIAGLFSLVLASKSAKRAKEEAEAMAKKEKEKEDNAILKKLDMLSSKLDEHIKEDNEAKTDEARLRVLRFGDEVRRGIQHTEEHWVDILRDIDRYEDYCEKHPEYENNRVTRTIEFLKGVFDVRLKKNDFLK
jgi:hypothetical protein